MLRKIASRVAPLAAGALLVLTTVGSASAAGKPSPQFSFAACWTGSTVLMTLTWSGAGVDAFDFGFSDAEGAGAGFQQPLAHPLRKGTAPSIGSDYALNPDLDLAASMGGGLTLRGQSVYSNSVDKPAGGWNTLTACP